MNFSFIWKAEWSLIDIIKSQNRLTLKDLHQSFGYNDDYYHNTDIIGKKVGQRFEEKGKEGLRNSVTDERKNLQQICVEENSINVK